MPGNDIIIESFHRADQEEVKTLILDGLSEHWGWIDYSANPDLDDIAADYARSVFLVARCDGRIIGTGALRDEARGTGRLVRMSVARKMRRRGVGTAIVDQLVCRAKGAGYEKVVLETTATWEDVIRFYIAYGFKITETDNENVHFVLDLVDGESKE